LCADVLPFKPLGIIKKISSKSPSQGSWFTEILS
jgi:hypothetical protein